MNESSKFHLTIAKQILQCLQGTKKFDIRYVKEKDTKLVGYTDNDWAGSIVDCKSTFNYFFDLGTKCWSGLCFKHLALCFVSHIS